MKVIVSSDFDSMSEAAAEDCIHLLNRIHKPLLCLASGNSPIGFLRLLRTHYSHRPRPDWYFVGLDEWIGIAPDEAGSCRHYLGKHLFQPLDVTEDRISFFDGMTQDPAAACRKAAAFVEAHKGIDICVLGIGTNGHLGLNEPGSTSDTPNRVVTLTGSTIDAAQFFFEGPRDIRHGIALGLSTLLAAKTVILLATGAGKAEIIQKTLEGPVDAEIPGSYLQQHPDCRVYLDVAAASHLQHGR